VAAPALDPLDQLFAAPLAEFTKARDRLAADLRKQGDKERAAEVKALSKPSAAAWAVNQAVRTSPEALRKLLEASDRMASLQLRAGADAKSRERFEEAAADHKAVMGQLVGNAGRALRDSGHAVTPVLLEKVSNNLKWAALDPEQRFFLSEGRLYKDLAPQGFGAFGAAGAEEEPTIELGRHHAESGPGPTLQRVVAFRKPEPEPAPPTDTRALRAELREAEKRVKEAEREAEQRSAAVRGAQQALAELERKTAAARESLMTATEAREQAQAALAQVEGQRRALAEALDRATRATLHPDDGGAAPVRGPAKGTDEKGHAGKHRR
jgi:hypothetical protein